MIILNVCSMCDLQPQWKLGFLLNLYLTCMFVLLLFRPHIHLSLKYSKWMWGPLAQLQDAVKEVRCMPVYFPVSFVLLSWSYLSFFCLLPQQQCASGWNIRTSLALEVQREAAPHHHPLIEIKGMDDDGSIVEERSHMETALLLKSRTLALWFQCRS